MIWIECFSAFIDLQIHCYSLSIRIRSLYGNAITFILLPKQIEQCNEISFSVNAFNDEESQSNQESIYYNFMASNSDFS